MNTINVKIEFRFHFILFCLLWLYIIIRANTVFFIHDEIVTKWLYMVDFNPFPYSGYLDANNHFLNSFIGGIAIRLFHSDALFIVRLGSVLAFPLFYWSLYNYRSFFTLKSSHLAFMTSCLGSLFILDYFVLARGYGFSLSLLSFAVVQMLFYQRHGNLKNAIFSVLSISLSIWANLTFIPICAVFILFYGIYSIIKKQYFLTSICLLLTFPFLYLIKYAFFLKDQGKLYYGGKEGFFENTVHSFSKYILETDHFTIDVLIFILFIGILYSFVKKGFSFSRLSNPSNFTLYLFLISLSNILLQRWMLQNNFPEDRSALYLLFFFFGSLYFCMDSLRLKWANYISIVISVTLFSLNFNLTSFKFFSYEHFDTELISKINKEIYNVPPSTGGRFWSMDDEIGRKEDFDTYVFQEAGSECDTLFDYVVIQHELRPNIIKLYHSIYKDPYSNLELFERKEPLKRELIQDTLINIDSQGEYINLMNMKIEEPVLLHFKGVLNEMTLKKDPILYSISKNDSNQIVSSLYGFSMMKSHFINDLGDLYFNFSKVLPKSDKHNMILSFFENKKREQIKGRIQISIYKLRK